MKTNASAKIEPLSEKSPPCWANILAPTDFSDQSIQAVKTAACLAEQCGAKIVLLHVVRLQASCPIEAALGVGEIMDSSRESLDEISEEIPAALVREKLVRFGTQGTVPEIIEATRELSADLIVIATHGHSRLERALLGTTAEKVVRHAPCPVLVVRRKEDLTEPNLKGRN
jgi:nucleotide-binding universal stress UspA family protein